MQELMSLKEEFAAMEQRLTEMEEKIDAISGKLTQVVDAILGNSLTKQGGFIAEISNLNKEIAYLKEEIEKLQIKQQGYETFKNRVIWTLGILGVGAAVIKWVISTFFVSTN